MMRRFMELSRFCLWPALLLLSFLPAMAFALGFGEVKLHSYINEPMDAEIELLGAESYEPERILVSLASAQEFKRAGLARPFLLSQLQFQVLRTQPNTVIRVTSHDPIHQPYLEFLIDLSWPGGRLVRGYTLLLDPAPAGIAPLHERRPPVVPRSLKENAVNAQAANAQSTNAQPVVAVAGAPNNFTQQNTFTQNTFSQNNQAQSTAQSMHSASHQNPAVMISASQPKVNSHQQRFEKLFDDRNGETNIHGESAPMTIVSAPDTDLPSVISGAVDTANRMPLQSVHPVQSMQPGQSMQPAYPVQSAQPLQPMHPMNTAHPQGAMYNNAAANPSAGNPNAGHPSPTAQNPQNSVFAFDKTQWMLIAITGSILILCITLMIIFTRRNKQKLNEARRTGMDTTIMQSPVAAPAAAGNFAAPYTPNVPPMPQTAYAEQQSHSYSQSYPSQVAAAAQATHAALYGGGLSTAPTPFGVSQAERPEPELKINPTIPNEMSMKLELAKNYFEIGDDESALSLLEDVAARGTDWEKQIAQRLLAENANAEMLS